MVKALFFNTHLTYLRVIFGLFAILLSALFTVDGLAQQIPDNQCTAVGILTGELKTDLEVGCVPLRVKARPSGSSVKNVRYIYDYRGGAVTLYQATSDSNYMYKKAGLYVLMQLSENVDGKAQRQCKTITVQDTLPPVITLKYCANGKMTLTFPKDPANSYDTYGVDWGDGAVEIVPKTITSVQHQYSSETTRKVRVQGIHNQGKCGGKVEKTVAPATAGQPPVITRLEIKNGNDAELTVSNPSESPMLIFRQSNNGTFTTTGKTTRLKTDKINVLADSNAFSCFKLLPDDNCGSMIESNVLCSVFIKGTNEDDRNVIATTPYLYPSAVKSISVTRNGQPWKALSLTELLLQDLAPECGKPTCYRVMVTTEKGISVSNEVCLNAPIGICGELGSVAVPSAFSPNGDNVNDVLEIKSSLSRNYELLVYDKWGNAVFSSDSLTKSWDGTSQGQLLPNGIYIYRLRVSDRAGRVITQRGILHLLR
jgi:gliding motility-associated-like protein